MCSRGPVDSSWLAQAAVEALNGAVVHVQELRASPSMPVRERAAALDGTFCSVYVRNLGPAARPSICQGLDGLQVTHAVRLPQNA